MMINRSVQGAKGDYFCCLAWTGNSAGSKQIILNFFGREVDILNIFR